MKRLLLAGLLALPVLAVFSSCKKAEAPAAATDETKTYTGHGEVLGFQADGRVVILKHDRIVGFMEGMTMGFELKDPAWSKALKKGDIVDFVLEVKGYDPLITKITKSAK